MLIYSLILSSCLLLPVVWGCAFNYQVLADKPTELDPFNYPNNYKANTSCTYKFTAPTNYYIEMKCTINLPGTNNQCSTDKVWVNREGDLLIPGSQYYCGTSNFIVYSLFTELVISYVSTSSKSGNFRCILEAKPQKCDCGWSSKSRIFNGEKAGETEFPSMVALRDKTKTIKKEKKDFFFCGGSIVSHRHIITAAHCLKMVTKVFDIQAVVGTNCLIEDDSLRYYYKYDIIDMVAHEKFNPNDKFKNHDIAVLTTSATIKWTRGVGPICLPPYNAQVFTDESVDVIGYGHLSFTGKKSTTLQKICINVGSPEKCQKEYKGINSNHICTHDHSFQYRDTCQVDSGGPVIKFLKRSSKLFLVGIISFGHGCGSSGHGVNTRVTTYVNWIRQKIGNSNCPVSM